MSRATRIVLGAVAAAVTLGAAMFAYFYAQTGLLASVRLPDGSEYMVSQRFSDGPFAVDFYMRPPGGRWGWCYIDHQTEG